MKPPAIRRSAPAPVTPSLPLSDRESAKLTVERKKGDYVMPPLTLLDAAKEAQKIDERELMEAAKLLEEKCREFSVEGSVVQIHPGPLVTTYEFKPDAGVKYSRITSLAEDLCLAMRAESILIDRIPGKSTVGIQIPNATRESISLRELLESDTYTRSASRLTMALGKTINGEPSVSDLATMPHLLIAGSTGAGKSVMRSYLGFDAKPVQVTGAVRQYELAPHWTRLAGTREARTGTHEHGIIEFAGGQVGVFHWTDVGYDSALRWWRSSRFLAEKGMGITVGVGLDVEERLSLLSPGGEAPHFITVERRWERIDGGAFISLVAHTGDSDLPIVQWDNPFRPVVQGHGMQWHDDEIGVAGCLLSLVEAVRKGTEPTYGAYQGRLDQELILALRMSSMAGGQPVTLPLDPTAQVI